jgi:hypothetical protein
VATLPVIQMADSVGQIVVRARPIDQGQITTSGGLHNGPCPGMSLVAGDYGHFVLGRVWLEKETREALVISSGGRGLP